MNDNNIDNKDESESSSAETEPQFRSILDPMEVKLPKINSILHEMEEKGIRLPTGLTKRIENIEVEDEEQRFTVLNQIGQGGMSHVYRVFDRDIGRTIAVKVVRLDKSSPVNFKRALNEMQITGQLEHPNIMPLHDVGIDGNNNIYFSMKLIKGEDLGSILENLRKNKLYKGFNRQRLLEIFIKVCDAVAFAHSRNVIHRDLKPHNIMVGEFGEVLLTDWGLAKIVKQKKVSRKFHSVKTLTQSSTNLNTVANDSTPYKEKSDHETDDTDFGTKHGAVAGTPAFMPPEQALGDIENIDNRSDIYSLGGILYHILTYFPPFVGTLPEIIEKVVKGDIRKPTNINDEIPKELEIIALKAMSHHKANRHQTVKQLKDEIQAFLENKPIDRISYTVFDLSKKFWIRNKLIFIWAFIAAVVAAFVVFIATRDHYEEKYKEVTELVEKLKDPDEILSNEYKTSVFNIQEMVSRLTSINTELEELDKSLKNFKDINALGLPRTGYYWQQMFKKQILSDEKYAIYRRMSQYSEFLSINSVNNLEIAKARDMFIELERTLPNSYSATKWNERERFETQRMLKQAQKQSQYPTINFSIETTDKTPVIEADIRLFRMVEGDRHNLSWRRFPIPYSFNSKESTITIPRQMQYAPITEIMKMWINFDIEYNSIDQNTNIEIVPGDYVMRISVNFLYKTVYLGLKISEINDHKFKIIIPSEDFTNKDFSFVPGIQYENDDAATSYQPFYIASTKVTFGDYLKFLNSKDNPEKLFENNGKNLPKHDDSAPMVKYDASSKRIVLQPGFYTNQPVTGICYLDIIDYLIWLNSQNTGKGKYELTNLQNYKRMNPYNWDYIWGYRDNKFFRLASKTEQYFADTNIFDVRGLNTGINEIIREIKSAKLYATSSDSNHKFSDLIKINHNYTSENTGFRLVYIPE